MEGLTKENFWNVIGEHNPTGLKHFCDWIDDWKKEVGFDLICYAAVKFHDLPLEMQHGIIVRYCFETKFGLVGYQTMVLTDFIHELEKFFLWRESGNRVCRVCGCTDDDCSQCIQKTGHACHWVEEDLCSACQPVQDIEMEEEPLIIAPQPQEGSRILLPGRDF
jgi:hypothetical protein